MFKEIIEYIRLLYKQQEGNIPLHAPHFGGNERKYVVDTLDSTFVSSIGEYVNKCEHLMKTITGAKHAIAVTNGTIALQLALEVSGVKKGDGVLTQSLSFIATSNAIHHAGAIPYYIDVDVDTMGLSPDKLYNFLSKQTEQKDNKCIHRNTQKPLSACVPMHTFGFPCRINEIIQVCNEFNIVVIEDAAESLGSYVDNRHTGSFGLTSSFSFNGNKTVTSGGGGVIITDDDYCAYRAKHLSTTAKIPHPWEYVHDDYGYNFRMPNINAALACAQLEQLPEFINNKKETASRYEHFFKNSEILFVKGIAGTNPNYWLNTILFENAVVKNEFLRYSNSVGIMARPAWELNHRLKIYSDSVHDDQSNAIYLADRIVNIPSSYRKE